MWLAPVIGALVIVGLAIAASFAQATSEVFIAASIMFSVCEGIVLAFVGFASSRRSTLAAATVSALSAALAAPVRWEFVFFRFHQPVRPTELFVDLLVSLAWGVLAGLAGATILRRRLAALTHSDAQRFRRPRPR